MEAKKSLKYIGRLTSKPYMETEKSFRYIGSLIALAILSSPLIALSPVEALPAGVPDQPCGTIPNPKPGTLCYTVTPGGGKVNAGGSPKDFPAIIIQATEPEYVIADVIIEITSDEGDRNLPVKSQLSPKGEASIVRESRQKQRDLEQIRGELQTKATVLAGPALIEAQAKISALKEQERIYESVVRDTITAGQDAGKIQVAGASARSRSCGTLGLDTCGSWVKYNVYEIRRYVGNPIAAYNRAFAVAQDAQNTINRLVVGNNTIPQPPNGGITPDPSNQGKTMIEQWGYTSTGCNPSSATIVMESQDYCVQPEKGLQSGMRYAYNSRKNILSLIPSPTSNNPKVVNTSSSTTEHTGETLSQPKSDSRVVCKDLTTVAFQGNASAEIIRWKSDEFGGNYTPQERCNIVSSKFDKAVKENFGNFQGLKLTNGPVNGRIVICVLKPGETDCTGENLLFTLKRENEPYSGRILAQLLQIGDNRAGVIEEASGDQVVVDLGLLMGQKLRANPNSARSMISPTPAVRPIQGTNGAFR